MPRVLVLFGSTDGHTAKVARFIGGELRTLGAEVDVVDAAHASPALQDYAAVIVAASIHAGGYQRKVIRWVRTHAMQLHLKPNAFVSVCLAVLQKNPAVQRDLEMIRDRFMGRTGWIPADIRIVAGALPYTRYGWFKRMIMQLIVKRVGGPTDASQDYEFTDWEGLRVFARQFHAMTVPPPAPAPASPRRSERSPETVALSGV
jgi:menaquinone-dependent protoporphyrinogen oxidase